MKEVLLAAIKKAKQPALILIIVGAFIVILLQMYMSNDPLLGTTQLVGGMLMIVGTAWAILSVIEPEKGQSTQPPPVIHQTQSVQQVVNVNVPPQAVAPAQEAPLPGAQQNQIVSQVVNVAPPVKAWKSRSRARKQAIPPAYTSPQLVKCLGCGAMVTPVKLGKLYRCPYCPYEFKSGKEQLRDLRESIDEIQDIFDR